MHGFGIAVGDAHLRGGGRAFKSMPKEGISKAQRGRYLKVYGETIWRE